MEFLHFFDTTSKHDIVYNGPDYGEPWTGLIDENGKVSYNRESEEYRYQRPLTFNIFSSGDIIWKVDEGGTPKTIEYRKNKGAWKEVTSTIAGTAIRVTAGDEINFRGGNASYSDGDYSNTFSGTTCLFTLKGNIMSMINPINYSGLTEFTNEYVFNALFMGCTGLTDAGEMLLPAQTLTTGCYSVMFGGCTSLTTPPVLPAKTLVGACYWGMFVLCENLNYINCQAEDISAENCTKGWVQGVAEYGSFVHAPGMEDWEYGVDGIPENWDIDIVYTDVISVLVDQYKCTTKINVTSTLSYWTIGKSDPWITTSIPSGGTGTTEVTIITASMPSGETGRTGYIYLYTTRRQPEAKVKIEQKKYVVWDITSPGDVRWSYTGNCGSRNIIYSVNGGEEQEATSVTGKTAEGIIISGLVAGDIVRFRGLNASYGYPVAGNYGTTYNTFDGSTCGFTLRGHISALLGGIDPKPHTFCSIFQGCSGLTDASELVLDIPVMVDNIYRQLFKSCSHLTKVPLLPELTLTSSCYRAMFDTCTSLVNGPVLPASVLVDSCYKYMYNGCKALRQITCLATNVSATDCLMTWVSGVTGVGVFRKSPDASVSIYTAGPNGIPLNWDVEDYLET